MNKPILSVQEFLSTIVKKEMSSDPRDPFFNPELDPTPKRKPETNPEVEPSSPERPEPKKEDTQSIGSSSA